MHIPFPPARVRGASLTETLVATVLGLLVLVLSTRSVLAFVTAENEQGEARLLIDSIDLARSEAAQRRSPVSICGLDPRDAGAAPGLVHCAPAGAAWHAGWIIYGDDNLNGELDDGEAVLRVVRDGRAAVFPDGEFPSASAITFRPIGTLASARPRRLLLATGAATAPTRAVCVAIDGYTHLLPLERACR